MRNGGFVLVVLVPKHQLGQKSIEKKLMKTTTYIYLSYCPSCPSQLSRVAREARPFMWVRSYPSNISSFAKSTRTARTLGQKVVTRCFKTKKHHSKPVLAGFCKVGQLGQNVDSASYRQRRNASGWLSDRVLNLRAASSKLPAHPLETADEVGQSTNGDPAPFSNHPSHYQQPKGGRHE